MAVTLTGTSSGDQGLFNRLGRMAYLLNLINTMRGTTFPTEVEDIIEYFDGANTTMRGIVEGLIPSMDSQDSAMGLLPADIQAAAENCLIEMFHADAPLPSKDIGSALDALKKQMLTATTSYVSPNTIAATYTGTSLTGNGNVVVSTLDGRGIPLENLIAERLRLTCTDDTIPGSEEITVLGELAETDKLAAQWPLGSGANRPYTSLNAEDTTNLVLNGGFEDFTANAPDDWTIVVGSAGTTIDDDASTFYEGLKALKFIGDGGGTLMQIRQDITANVEAGTPYAVNFWCRNSTNPAAGVLTVDLYDGSGVINDEAGTANSFTVDLTTLGTSFVAKSGVFRLPEPMPAAVYIRVRVSTAITDTHTLYIDHLGLQEMFQPDQSSQGSTPFIAVFSGATNWSLDDGRADLTNVFKIETTNDYASQGDANWQRMFDRLFNTGASGYTLPTTGTTLINTSLIA